MTDESRWTSHDVHNFIHSVAIDVRNSTESAFAGPLGLWSDSITLRIAPFLPGSTSTIVESESTHEGRIWNLAFEYRMSQSISTIATSRLAMEAILSGYYAQALGILRNLVESWKRTTFVRRKPDSVGRWMEEQYVIESLGVSLPVPKSRHQPSSEEWDEVFPKTDHLTPLDYNDRTMLDLLNEHLRDLHAFVHPNFTGYLQHLGKDRRNINPLPPFRRETASQVIHLLNVVEFGWLWELPHLVQLPQDWRTQMVEWGERFKAEYSDRATSPPSP